MPATTIYKHVSLLSQLAIDSKNTYIAGWYTEGQPSDSMTFVGAELTLICKSQGESEATAMNWLVEGQKIVENDNHIFVSNQLF